MNELSQLYQPQLRSRRETHEVEGSGQVVVEEAVEAAEVLQHFRSLYFQAELTLPEGVQPLGEFNTVATVDHVELDM